MNKRFKWHDPDRGWMVREVDKDGAFVQVHVMASEAHATQWVKEARSTRHPHPTNPAVGVRVWYGREYVEGPDCLMRGWFFAVYDGSGEGDATGPFRGKHAEQEATKLALDILGGLWS